MLRLVPFHQSEKHLLEQLLLDYFKEIDRSKIILQEEELHLHYPYLNQYWSDTNRWSIKIIYREATVGFVLVNNISIVNNRKVDFAVAEFYIKSSFRRQGLGQRVAQELFSQFTGKWEVKQDASNCVAIKFWRTVIQSYTQGNYKEITLQSDQDTNIVQWFSS